MFGLMQMITLNMPELYWAFILGLMIFGVWKICEIMAWLYANTGVHTPSLQ